MIRAIWSCERIGCDPSGIGCDISEFQTLVRKQCHTVVGAMLSLSPKGRLLLRGTIPKCSSQFSEAFWLVSAQ